MSKMLLQYYHSILCRTCNTILHKKMGKLIKGSNEILKFLIIIQLFLFSVACVWQNRDHVVIRIMCPSCKSKDSRKQINFFPIREHFFLSCDRNFPIIVNNIYPSKYVSIVLTSSVHNKFLVNYLESKDKEIKKKKLLLSKVEINIHTAK